MKDMTRRDAIKMATAAGAAGIGMMAAPTTASAQLFGTWIVRCPKCSKDDQVESITLNHDCSKCKTQSVKGGSADVVCPDGHTSHVEAATRQHKCSHKLKDGGECAKQCLRS